MYFLKIFYLYLNVKLRTNLGKTFYNYAIYVLNPEGCISSMAYVQNLPNKLKIDSSV